MRGEVYWVTRIHRHRGRISILPYWRRSIRMSGWSLGWNALRHRSWSCGIDDDHLLMIRRRDERSPWYMKWIRRQMLLRGAF